jgi:peptidyl-prolyl cis-trans isomerase A (cyclophilin A)
MKPLASLSPADRRRVLGGSLGGLAGLAGIVVGLACAACRNTPPEPEPMQREPASITSGDGGTASGAGHVRPVGSAALSASVAKRTAPVAPDDPLKGKWTLADATKGIAGKGPLVATLKTSSGDLRCKLFDDKAPNTVANFVGLATGKRTWKDPSGKWVNKPAYDGTTFHRIIKGFMIQGGDARGNGTGEPGYVIADEIWPGAKHDRAGLLCMANRGKDTNGAQFFITDAAAPHLDASYTIFGECTPEAIVHAIASVPVDGEKPEKPVTIESVKIAR